jgi:hypothetical protein
MPPTPKRTTLTPTVAPSPTTRRRRCHRFPADVTADRRKVDDVAKLIASQRIKSQTP